MIYDIQKASFGKRISAYIFDLILLSIVATGVATLFSWAFGYDAKYEEYDSYRNEYADLYGIDLNIKDEAYEALSDEEKKLYDDAATAFRADENVTVLYVSIINLTILITSFSLLAAFLVVEFTIPLFLKNGQTVGKKIFGIAVIGVDGVKIKPMALFIRAILGKYTIGTMVPIAMIALIILGGAGIFGIGALLLLICFEIGLLIKTEHNYAIHDLLSYTVAVDLQSQMIFETKEELIAYKNKLHADIVSRED